MGSQRRRGEEPVDGNKVIRVDFRRGRRPSAGGFGGGPRLLFAVFLGVLVVELLLVAAFYPQAIGSFFFGPTVIALAVACTLWARRGIARMQVSHLHRHTVGRREGSGDDDHRGHTLH